MEIFGEEKLHRFMNELCHKCEYHQTTFPKLSRDYDYCHKTETEFISQERAFVFNTCPKVREYILTNSHKDKDVYGLKFEKICLIDPSILEDSVNNDPEHIRYLTNNNMNYYEIIVNNYMYVLDFNDPKVKKCGVFVDVEDIFSSGMYPGRNYGYTDFGTVLHIMDAMKKSIDMYDIKEFIPLKDYNYKFRNEYKDYSINLSGLEGMDNFLSIRIHHPIINLPLYERFSTISNFKNYISKLQKIKDIYLEAANLER
jgi:hypothetical protein